MQICAPVKNSRQEEIIAQTAERWNHLFEKFLFQKRRAFHGYQINDEVMAQAHDDAMVLHCLPAHREEEITTKVFEAHANEIFEEAENRLHAQKAVMVKLMA